MTPRLENPGFIDPRPDFSRNIYLSYWFIRTYVFTGKAGKVSIKGRFIFIISFT